jgi:hypothetical protein
MSSMMDGGWRNPDYGFNPQGATSGLSQFLSGIFGHSDEPYDKAQEQYRQWGDKSQGVQQPFLNAGTGALNNYQQWLQTQKDPSKFINDQMSNYQESPYAHFLQQQSMRAGQNAASASGLSGSTPLYQQLSQDAHNISSQDQNQWLKNVLGINTQYGQGQNNLVQTGQNSANSLSRLYNTMGDRMGDAAYGQEQGKHQDLWNTIGGGLSILGSFL